MLSKTVSSQLLEKILREQDDWLAYFATRSPRPDPARKISQRLHSHYRMRLAQLWLEDTSEMTQAELDAQAAAIHAEWQQDIAALRSLTDAIDGNAGRATEVAR